MYLITIDFSKLGKKLNDDTIPLRNMLLTRKIKLNYTYPKENGTTLTRPCSRFPGTVGPGVSSNPDISGPKGTTSPVTSGPNSHVDLFQVYPL